MKFLSVVIPAYNESEVMPITLNATYEIMVEMGAPFEIIVVDDGSSDNTVSVLQDLKINFPNLRIIAHKKNYGHMDALLSGLKVARGDLIATMDADMQDPPELLSSMFQVMIESRKTDIVQAVRSNRESDTRFKRLSASFFYCIARKLTGQEITPHAADFRVMSRESVLLILELPEKKKILRFLIPYLGMKVETLEFTRKARVKGVSKYPFRKMVALAFDSIIGFSSIPLRAISIFGLASAGLFLIGSVISVIIWMYAKTIPGWTSLALLMLSANALVIACLGLIGEYISRIFEISLDRPDAQYIEL
jgi:dolichol-phosphate mannosyltransferase